MKWVRWVRQTGYGQTMNPQHRLEVVFGKRREDDLQERSAGLARAADLMRSTTTSTSVTLPHCVL